MRFLVVSGYTLTLTCRTTRATSLGSRQTATSMSGMSGSGRRRETICATRGRGAQAHPVRTAGQHSHRPQRRLAHRHATERGPSTIFREKMARLSRRPNETRARACSCSYKHSVQRGPLLLRDRSVIGRNKSIAATTPYGECRPSAESPDLIPRASGRRSHNPDLTAPRASEHQAHLCAAMASLILSSLAPENSWTFAPDL